MSREEILRWVLLSAYPAHEQVIRDGKISTNPRHYQPLIFSHHFAQAFWGEDWDHHRAQLLGHSDDPLSYLARFVNGGRPCAS
jgi:hypothetical protein